MEENQYLKMRAQDISREVDSLEKKIISLLSSFPGSARRRVVDKINKDYLAQSELFSHRVMLQNKTWKLEIYWRAVTYSIAYSDCIDVEIVLSKSMVGIHINTESTLCGLLAGEDDWREICDFVSAAINSLKIIIDLIFQEEIKQLDPEAVGLLRALKETKETCQRLQEENNQLLLEQGYIQQNNENLKSAIKQSIPQLQKAAQDLRNTRGFLGQSKTIKGIRENIEKVIADFWKVAYPNEPPLSQPIIEVRGPIRRSKSKPSIPDDKIALT